jgi:hypothetical protein
MRCDSSKLVGVVSYVTLEVMLVRRSLAAQNFPGVLSHAKKKASVSAPYCRGCPRPLLWDNIIHANIFPYTIIHFLFNLMKLILHQHALQFEGKERAHHRRIAVS